VTLVQYVEPQSLPPSGAGEFLARTEVSPRYAEIRDCVLARCLTAEDQAEEASQLVPECRVTCHHHRRWLHHCVGSPAHVNVVTGTRWCRRCECALNVAIDQLTGSVTVRCPECGRGAETRYNHQLVASCQKSLALAQRRSMAVAEANGSHRKPAATDSGRARTPEVSTADLAGVGPRVALRGDPDSGQREPRACTAVAGSQIAGDGSRW
jgi:hypothetical protein